MLKELKQLSFNRNFYESLDKNFIAPQATVLSSKNIGTNRITEPNLQLYIKPNIFQFLYRTFAEDARLQVLLGKQI